MAKPFDPKMIERNLSLFFDETVEKTMARQADTILRLVKREQARLFAVLATQAMGTKDTPASVRYLQGYGVHGGGTIPWSKLTPGWLEQKKSDPKDRFFVDTGELRSSIESLDYVDIFGEPEIYQGKDKSFKFTSKFTWTIRVYPKLGRARNYPNFKGLEGHPGIQATGQAQKFYAPPDGGGKPYLKRPLLQPFMLTWNLRLRRLIEASRRDSTTMRMG